MGLFDHIPAPAISLDHDFRIQKTNSRANSLFGWQSLPVEPVPFTAYLASAEVPGFLQFCRSLAVDREMMLSIGIFPQCNLRVPVTIRGTRTPGGECILLIDKNDACFTGCGGKCLHAAILANQFRDNPCGMVLVNDRMEMISFNSAFVRIWNLPNEIQQSRNERACLQIILDHLAEPAGFLDRVNELYRNTGQVHTDQLFLRDGRVLYRHTHPLYSAGNYLGRFWYYLDITAFKTAHYQLERQRLLHNAILENIQDGIAACDADGKICLFNRASRHLYGQTLGDKPVHLADLEHYDPDDISPIPPEATPLARALAGETLKNEEVVILRKHTQHNLRVNGQAMYDGEGNKLGAVISLHDITDLNRVKEQLRFMAYHDALTGLPNRRLFHDLLLHSLRHAQRHNEQVGVLVLDLDNFKAINDVFGHEVGDQVLQEVADSLRQFLRGSDILCRWGGDEFVIALLESGHANGVEKLAARLCEKVLDRVLTTGKSRLSVSVGIAMFPRHGTEPDLLIRNADMAMYRAKRLGRNRCEVFQPEDLASSLTKE